MYMQVSKKLVALVMVSALLVMMLLPGFACDIFDEARPRAGFSAEPRSGAAPLEVEFTDQSSGEIDDWEWDFNNDGIVDSTGRSPSYTYTTTGVYTVSLEVMGPGGSDKEVKAQYIEVAIPTPEALFTASPLAGTAPLEVQFTDQSTGEVTGWEWDFNSDGIVDSTERNPSYTYTTIGVYTVSLEVTGPDGSDTLTRQDYIEVGVGL